MRTECWPESLKGKKNMRDLGGRWKNSGPKTIGRECVDGIEMC